MLYAKLLQDMNATQLIDKQIAGLGDWRGEVVIRLRKIIHSVDPEIKEEWKWETGVWAHNGMVCAIGTFKDHVKINFFKGANLKDQHKLFNSGLEAKKTRAIDFYENDKLNEDKLEDLIKEANDQNDHK